MSGKKQKHPATVPPADEGQTSTEAGLLDAKELAERLELVTKERDEARDQALRALADYRNLRKRVEAERQTIRAQAFEEAALAVLPALDDLERALANFEQASEPEAVIEGLRLIQKQLVEALARLGISPIETVGKPFDPKYHEAVAVTETMEYAPDTVIEELRRGYMLNGRVVRASRVRVSKAPDDPGVNE